MFLNSKARTNNRAHILLLGFLIIGSLAFSSCATLIEKFLSVKVNENTNENTNEEANEEANENTNDERIKAQEAIKGKEKGLNNKNKKNK